MNKSQANALMAALEAAGVPAQASFTFSSPGVSAWTVTFPPNAVYAGDQLAALTSYCAAHGLTVSAQFSALGVV